MNFIYRSILARSLMTGVASLAFVVMAPVGVRGETVTVQGDNGANGMDGVLRTAPANLAATENP